MINGFNPMGRGALLQYDIKIESIKMEKTE